MYLSMQRQRPYNHIMYRQYMKINVQAFLQVSQMAKEPKPQIKQTTNIHVRHQSRFVVRNGKKSPNQGTDLGNRGPLEPLNDAKLILNDAHSVPIWYHSGPSNVPYSPNQFLGWDFYFPFLTERRLQQERFFRAYLA